MRTHLKGQPRSKELQATSFESSDKLMENDNLNESSTKGVGTKANSTSNSQKLMKVAALFASLGLLFIGGFAFLQTHKNARSEVGALASFGFNSSVLRKLAALIFCLGVGSILHLLASGQKKTKGLSLVCLVVISCIICLQLSDFSKSIRAVEVQVRNHMNENRVIASIHEHVLNPACGNKYLPALDTHSTLMKWEEPQASHSGLNPICAKAARDIFTSTLETMKLLATVVLLLFVVVLGGSSEITALTKKAKSLVLSVSMAIFALAFIISNLISTEYDPALMTMSSLNSSVSRARVSSIYSSSSSYEVKGSINAKNCPSHWAIIVANYGTNQETFHRPEEDCSFNFEQLAGHSKIAVVVNHQKNILDLTGRVSLSSGKIRLDNLPVVLSHEKNLKLSFSAEDLLTGEGIDNFKVTIRSNLKGNVIRELFSSKTNNLISTELISGYYTVTVSATGYESKEIQFEDLFSRSSFKTYLIKESSGLKTVERRISSIAANELVARVIYPDSTVCLATSSNPICAGVLHLVKEAEDEDYYTEFILISQSEDISVEVSVSFKSVNMPTPSHRVLESSNYGKLVFDDQSIISRAGLKAYASPNRFAKPSMVTLKQVNKAKYTYNHPADIVKALIPTPGAWAPRLYEVIPINVGRQFVNFTPLSDQKGPDTVFGEVQFNQKIKAAKFKGDDGAVWYAMIYNSTGFVIVTDGINNPALIRSPGGPVAQILNDGDKVYPFLNNTWLSVTMPNGSYFNFNKTVYDRLNALPFTDIPALPKLDVQSSNALNSKLTAFGSILADLIVEVLNTTEYQDMMSRLNNFGTDIPADVQTSSVYLAKKIRTYIHHNQVANYRICLPCLFYELKRMNRVHMGFNSTYSNGTLRYTVREDQIEKLFWLLQHRVPTVTFVEGDHYHISSLFAELNDNKYLELNRTDMASIISLQNQGLLKNEWVKAQLKNETKVDGNLTPLIIYDNLLFRLNMDVARAFVANPDRASYEPELYKMNVGNRIDSRSDYYGGLSIQQDFLDKLFTRFANTRGVFTRSNHDVPVRTWPFILRKEDAVVNKYFFNLVEARAALGLVPVPYSGIARPYDAKFDAIVYDQAHNKFLANPIPLPPKSVYLDPLPVIFTDGTTQVPTGQCLDNMADLNIFGLFTTYNRTTKKLTITERSVFIRNHLLRIFETQIVVRKFATNTFSSPAEEKVLRDCFPVTSSAPPPLPVSAFLTHFVLHDNASFAVGVCNGAYTNGLRCVGTFTGNDVRCTNNLSINGVPFSNLTNANMTSNDFSRLVVSNQADISCSRLEANSFTCEGTLVPGYCNGNFSGHYDNSSVAQDIDTNKTTQGKFNFIDSIATTPSVVDFNAKSKYKWSSDSSCELSYNRTQSLCQRAYTNGTITLNDGNGTADYTGRVMVFCEGYLNLDTMNCSNGLFQATMCNNTFDTGFDPRNCSGSYFYRTCPNGGNLTTCIGQPVTPVVTCLGRYTPDGVCVPKTLIPIININITHWLKGSCNETIGNNKCVGIFNASSDQVVRCSGSPNTSQADYDACVPDRGSSFGSCKGITSEKGCEGIYRQTVNIGSETWVVNSLVPGLYNYSTMVGLSRHTWINPATTGPDSEISKRVRCSNSVQPGRLFTCDDTQYIWFDDQDDTSIPGINRRIDILCTEGMLFDYPTLSCRGTGNHTYQLGVGRNEYRGDLKNYSLLGNLTKILCINGGTLDKCTSDTGKLTYSCIDTYYADLICSKDIPQSNNQVNITFTGITYRLDIFGKKFKVCNFLMPSFMTSNTYTTSINITNQVAFRVELRNFTMDPVTGDLNNITIPRDVTNVAFDEGTINSARFKDFRIMGFDFKRLAVDDECKLVHIKMTELLVKRTVVKDLHSRDGVIMFVKLVTNTGANEVTDSDFSLLPNFGYSQIDSPLAYGEIYIRNVELNMPYVSSGIIDQYLKADPGKIQAQGIVVPLTGEDLDLQPFTIGITADRKDIFLEYKELKLSNLSLDLLTLNDWLLSSSSLKSNPSVVTKLMNGYVLDQRLTKLYGDPPKP